jgi:hypothetical protein
MKAVSGPINVTLMKHDRVGDLLKEIRELIKVMKFQMTGANNSNFFTRS